MGHSYVTRAGIVILASILLATVPTGIGFAQNTKASKENTKASKVRGASTARPEHVRELQEALAKSGYDPGPIDGIMGPRTKDALRKYMAVPPPKEPSPADQVIARFRTERREAP